MQAATPHRTQPPRPPNSTVWTDQPRLRVTSYGLSDPGRVRQTNEDRFVIADFARAVTVSHTNVPQPLSRVSGQNVHLFLVADGVGGHKAGDVASALSVMSVEELLLNTTRRLTMLRPGEEQTVLAELQGALEQADAGLFRAAAGHQEWRGMGTTLTMAVAVNRQLLVAHAGDSRCYLFSGGKLEQITRDHTLPAELERAGLITRRDLATHPWRHVVTNIVGGMEPGVRSELHSLELHPQDVILLCSDGLTEMVPDEVIADTLRAEADPQRACASLVAEANRLGGRDNVTVILARFSEPGTIPAGEVPSTASPK
jgi:serine/threonine protein phosphatase PrpC